MEMTSGKVDAWRDLYNGVNTLAAAESEEERDAWYMRLQGLDPDGTGNPSYPVLLDADNLIQYMLVIFWTGNPDAPITPFMGTNNFFGYRDRTGDHGFKWFAHDSEHALLDPSIDRTGPFPAGDQFRFSNPQWIHQQLMGSPEYRFRFADFAHRHLFDGGAMTTSPSVARMDTRKAEIEDVLISESARWGDAKREPPRGLADWKTEVARLRNGILPARGDVLLEQLQTAQRFVRGESGAGTTPAPLYPSVDAPAFSHDGGEISGSDQVTLDAPSGGSVYYTLDGSDPRLLGGAVSGAAVEYDGEALPLAGRQTVSARFLSDEGEWSARSDAEYFVDTAAPTPGALVISEIYYHPPDPTPGEQAAGMVDGDDFEFIELHNRSDRAVALAGLSFTNGIDFSFGSTSLAS
ncbi:MAG: chitobiase/beta-hexosaminidase C-terminal domain-containing protein, partial [Rhodothermales bacterium]